MLFLVDLWLDGYDSDDELKEACIEFIYEQLNMTASSVTISELTKENGIKKLQEKLED